MKKFLAISLLIYSVSSFIPLLKSTHWAVRLMDFPRMQFLALGLLIFLLLIKFLRNEKRRYLSLLIIPIVAIGLDIYRLYPYSPLSPIESKMHKQMKNEFSVMIFNVLQTNTEKGKLADLIKEKNPDFIFLFEVDKKWTDSLSSLPGYLERHYGPLDNTYGIAFLGKKKVDSVSMKYLVENDVPSYEVTFRPEGGEVVTLFAVHPRPPKPPVESEQRDAELVLIAKKAREIKGPVLVVGDMNDVAWSHTTRLFRRISGLLDPRVGRSPFATFPAINILLRFPLDYIFHSEELKLTGIEILPDIDSDHLPLMASFYLDNKKDQESFEKPESEDFKEANKIIREGKDN